MTSFEDRFGQSKTETLTNKSIDSDNNTITNIVDADIKAAAGIVDTKLATISTAGKVSGAAITSGEIAGSTSINTSGAITTTGLFTSVGIDDNASSNAVTIDASQNVGIGTTVPDGTVHIHTTSAGAVTANAVADNLVVEGSGDTGISILTTNASAGYLVFGDTDSNLSGQLWYNHSGDTFNFTLAGTTRMVIDSDLHPNTDTGMNCGTSSKRWGEVFASVGTINTSDERLKTNIQPLEDVLDKVLMLSPSRWNSKYEDYYVGFMGFVAQDLELQFPELVQTREEDINGVQNIKTISASGPEIIAILTKAIQELSAKNDTLIVEKEALEATQISMQDQLATLSARLDILENS